MSEASVLEYNDIFYSNSNNVIILVGKYILLVSVCVPMSSGLRNYSRQEVLFTKINYFWQIDFTVIISTPPTPTQHQYTLVVPKPASSDAKVKDLCTVIYSVLDKEKLKPVIPTPGTSACVYNECLNCGTVYIHAVES